MLTCRIPAKIKIEWGQDYIKLEGPLGLLLKRKGHFHLAQDGTTLYLWSFDNKENAYLATVRALIAGVSNGVSRKLRLVGIGFRAFIEGNFLFLKLGFSHEVKYKIPEDVIILVAKNKGTTIVIKGKEKYRVQQVAHEIRALRKPDLYKGKGVQYKKEILFLKKGKKDSK